MDPFTAIALAGNILQFVAFAKDCYVQVKQVQESSSGMTEKDAGVWEHTEKVDEFIDSVSAATKSFADENLTSTEEGVRDAGKECQRLAHELRDDLKSRAIKPRTGTFRATTNVIAGKWKLSDIQQKLNDLESLQTRLSRLLLAQIGQRQSGLELAMAKLMTQHRQLEMTRASDLEQCKLDILAALPRITDDSVEQIGSMLIDWAGRADWWRKAAAILQTLRFDGMFNRHEDIPDAEPYTFQWVKKPELHFQDWLSKDDGAYWVTGEPGSGKSTLMKHLSNHEETRRCLVQWAGEKTLVTAKYFFWFTGAILQRSQEGLLRSLLFEILRQCPSLIPHLFSSRWTLDAESPWTRTELMEALKSLTLQSTSTKFFFIIDGLDEYQGDQDRPLTSEDGVAPHLAEIIEVMKILSGFKDIKLCLSSRPWLDFEQAFGGVAQRKLYVHQENADDIRLYIRKRFEQSVNFVQSTSNREELQQIVDDMVEHSRGVFLWVYLAVENLLRGLKNKDRVAELRRRLDQLPKRLHDMFDRMLGTVEGVYQEQAAKILQIALHARKPMYVAIYSMVTDDVDDADGDMGISALEPKPWSAQECVELSECTEHRLKVRCPDLITVRGEAKNMTSAHIMAEHRVEFLHRTVRDFLMLAESQTKLRQRLKRPFDAAAFIARALLIHIAHARVSRGNTWTRNVTGLHEMLDDFLNYTAELELRDHTPQTMLLDQLEHVIAQQTGNPEFLLRGHSFVSVVAQKDMLLYVQTKLPSALTGPGPPLLHCVLCPRWLRSYSVANGGDEFCDSFEMVQLLLEHGANPNQVIFNEDITIWDKYVRQIRKNRMSTNTRRTQLKIVQSLLEHGANPDLRYFLGYGPPAKSTFSRPIIREHGKYQDLTNLLSSAFFEDRGFVELLVLEQRKKASIFSGFGMPRWINYIF